MRLSETLLTLLERNLKLTTPESLKDTNSQKKYLKQLEKLQESYAFFNGKIELEKDLKDQIKKTESGILGEDNVSQELKEHSNIGMYIMSDMYFENSDGEGSQIDLILITNKHIYILEVKHVSDYMVWHITPNGKSLTYHKNSKKENRTGIDQDDPFEQNNWHIKVFKNIIESNSFLKKHIQEKDLCGMVILGNPTTKPYDKKAPEKISSKIISINDLQDFIEKQEKDTKHIAFSPSTMQKIGKILLDCSSTNPEYFSKIEIFKESLADYLREQLKKYRSNKAHEEKTQAFKIFHDKTMEELIVKRPKSLEELAKINRLGPNSRSFQKYGKDILKILNGELSFPNSE